MKIHLSLPDSPYFVRRYEAHPTPRITLNNTDYFHSLVLHKDLLIPTLPFENLEAISEDFCEELSQRAPQVLLLGAGDSQDIPHHLLRQAFKAFIQKQIGIEIMTTSAAARTYNILAQEGRDVMAIFMLQKVSKN
jgi:uncharacterized protein